MGAEELVGSEQFYKVPLDLYRIEDPVEVNLYFYFQRQYILFKSKGSVWSREDSEKLKSSQITSLFTKFNSQKDHHFYLHEKLSALLDKPNVPLRRKAQVLYEIADPILSTVVKTPDSAEIMDSAVNYVKDCVKFLNARNSLPELVKLSAGNLTEHVHALHVAAYSVALGKKTGSLDPSQIFALGMGAILHDIGKSRLNPKMLVKASELDQSEWTEMRQHPEYGEKILERRQMVPLLSRRIVVEHHERVNGKGYPRGIKNLHPFSRIVGIADCFNSLVSDRPYRKGMNPFEALKFMAVNLKKEYDTAFFEAFIAMLGE